MGERVSAGWSEGAAVTGAPSDVGREVKRSGGRLVGTGGLLLGTGGLFTAVAVAAGEAAAAAPAGDALADAVPAPAAADELALAGKGVVGGETAPGEATRRGAPEASSE